VISQGVTGFLFLVLTSNLIAVFLQQQTNGGIVGITIEGCKVIRVAADRDKDTGEMKLTGSYELISSTGVVIAKQGFNGYNEITLGLSSETIVAREAFLRGLSKDLNTTLGLN
jgi:hypothetical protein